MKTNRVTVHRDNSITYWSVYGQAWVYRANIVPDRELAAMPPALREIVVCAMRKNTEADRERYLSNQRSISQKRSVESVHDELRKNA
jgi:hypothetical protein